MRKFILTASTISLLAAAPVWAKPTYRPMLLSNNSGTSSSTTIGKSIWQTVSIGNVNWISKPSQTLPTASAPKTIAATVKYGPNSAEPMAAIMYRDPANGNINMVEPISVSQDGLYNVTSSGGSPVLHAVTGAPFTHLAEEIEMDPVSGDIFALVVNGSSRQVYRIDRATNEAKVMTLYNAPVGINPPMVSPNGNKIYWNTLSGGYRHGSIAFVPNPQNPNESLMAFTHESTIGRYRLCTWYFKPDGDKLIGMPNGPGTMNRCWGVHAITGVTLPGIPLLSSILPGTGLNTAFAEGKLVIARDNESLMKLDWAAYVPGVSGSPAASIKPLDDVPSGTPTQMDMSSDFAYWKNF